MSSDIFHQRKKESVARETYCMPDDVNWIMLLRAKRSFCYGESSSEITFIFLYSDDFKLYVALHLQVYMYDVYLYIFDDLDVISGGGVGGGCHKITYNFNIQILLIACLRACLLVCLLECVLA